MELYGRIYRVVEPKRQRLQAATEQLKEKQASLDDAKRKLAEVTEKMENLKKKVRQIAARSDYTQWFAEITYAQLSVYLNTFSNRFHIRLHGRR